jgi:hypothetical protein
MFDSKVSLMLRGHRAVGRLQSRLTLLTIVVGVAAAVQPGTAAVKIRVDFDKAFDFRQAKTWAWNTEEAGYVRVARTANDDPDEIRSRAQPLILSAVRAVMPKRGLMPAAGTPDLTLRYFLLLTLGASTQTLGQFLPSVAQWGVPPFAQVTTSFEAIEQGSLVLDLSANGRPVWRGIAEAQIKMELDQDKRAALIREAVEKILERYPPKK